MLQFLRRTHSSLPITNPPIIYHSINSFFQRFILISLLRGKIVSIFPYTLPFRNFPAFRDRVKISMCGFKYFKAPQVKKKLFLAFGLDVSITNISNTVKSTISKIGVYVTYYLDTQEVLPNISKSEVATYIYQFSHKRLEGFKKIKILTTFLTLYNFL